MRISGLVALVFQAYFLVLFARVILSWMNLSSQRGLASTIGPIVYRLTEPLLSPIRNWLRPHMRNTPVDFSPLVLWLALSIVEQLVLRMLAGAGL